MSLLDDLRNAAKELAEEVPFTQERWVEALIQGWMKERAMGAVLVWAAGWPDGERIPTSTWEKWRIFAGTMKPAMNPYSSLKNPVRVWIASNATSANVALWDGRIEDARKLLPNGGKSPDALAAQKRAVKAEQKKDMRGKLYLNLRERDKRTDWGTCK